MAKKPLQQAAKVSDDDGITFESDADSGVVNAKAKATESEEIVLIDALKSENATLIAQLTLHQKTLEEKSALCSSLEARILLLESEIQVKDKEIESLKSCNKDAGDKLGKDTPVSNIISFLHERLTEERQKEVLSLLHLDWVKLSYKDFSEKEKEEFQQKTVARFMREQLEGRATALKKMTKKE